MEVTVLEYGDPRWRDALTMIPYDVYHLPEYARLSARDGDSVVAFLMEEEDCRCLIPLVVRPLPGLLGLNGNWRDATSPYGYPGPIVSTNATADWWNRSLEAFTKAAREREIIAAFLRWNPLFEDSGRIPLACEQRVYHGETAYIRLDETEEEWQKQTRSDHRYQIRRLEREGFALQMDDWGLMDQFISIYHDTMRRLGSDEFYAFSHEYFASLRQALGQGLHLGCVMSPGGEVAAAGLFTECNGIVQYHLSGTAEQFLKQAPMKLLLHSVRSWAKPRGNRVFHLGGGVGGNCDSLFLFKAAFTRHRGIFYTSRLILNEERYGLANRKASSSAECLFFPAYRRAS